MLKRVAIFTIILFSVQNQSQTKESEDKRLHQKEIIQEYVHKCAKNYNYNYQVKEWQFCLDQGLKKDSTIAYLWQQKAMPYFKMKKYEVGMGYIDNAVEYDAQSWQPYRAFIKCIFYKTYKDAIKDFEECISKWGDNYEMDHTYSFYIGLCHLQLNEFEKAEQYLQQTIAEQRKRINDVHHLDLFYYAVTKYELGKYDEAVKIFDETIAKYSKFSDAIYYRAICLLRQNKSSDEIQNLISQAKEFAEKGYTINEDNVVYEPYPYQVKW